MKPAMLSTISSFARSGLIVLAALSSLPASALPLAAIGQASVPDSASKPILVWDGHHHGGWGHHRYDNYYPGYDDSYSGYYDEPIYRPRVYRRHYNNYYRPRVHHRYYNHDYYRGGYDDDGYDGSTDRLR